LLITEYETIKNIEYLEEKINVLIENGFSFILNNFSFNSISFLNLEKFKIKYIKIDEYLIKNLKERPKNKIFIKYIVNIAKELNIKTIAYFIEDKETYNKPSEFKKRGLNE